jgi:hypothetical protein
MGTSTLTIRRQLTQMVLFTSGAALLLAVISMFAYDFITFRQASQRQLEMRFSSTSTSLTRRCIDSMAHSLPSIPAMRQPANFLRN